MWAMAERIGTVVVAARAHRAPWIAALLLAIAPSLCLAGERVALLVGTNLSKKQPLRNAVNDATDMAKVLADAGFRTRLLADGNTAQLRAAVDEFGRDLAGAEAAFFFFAGNAVQYDTRIFMLSSDTERDDSDFMNHSVEITRIFQLIRAGAPKNAFVVFDSNRDAPGLPGPAGLREASGDPPIPPNTFVAYATEVGGSAADGYGRNGVFTGEILKQIRTPGLPAEIVFRRARQGVIQKTRNASFRQVPQESSSLSADFTFFAAETATSTPVATVLRAPPNEKRVALVIGNAGYKVAPLVNTLNDADDMAAALEKAGFRTILRKDASQREMRAAIREFEREMAKSDVGLFYFAGHGLQIRGSNFLVPVDADMQSEADAEDQSVDANFVLRVLDDTQAKVGIVILDACRNNPLPRRSRGPVQGLAQMNAATGMLIAFATSPGAGASDGGVGRNGTYVKHLLASLEHEDTDILKVFQRTRAGVVRESKGTQVPWESTSLMGDFRFRVRLPAN
jgi:uncharacterized caspase-like protein